MSSFVPTLTLITALKTVLEAIPLPGGADGEKLFERVDFHENKKLKEALTDLIIVKQRVCIIVPGGDGYTNVKEARTIRSVRHSTLDLLIADRSWTKGGYDALVGGPKNVGILAMKDLVVNTLADNPQLATGDPLTPLPWVVLQPEQGAEITIADAVAKDTPGRECWVQGYSTPAGQRVLTPTRAWTE